MRKPVDLLLEGGRFREERRQPFLDLLALVRRAEGMRVVDLGCGTGELTAQAHRALGARETLGIDSSPAMLERARPLPGDGLAFEQGDIAGFAGEGFDLVLSNAALHWVPGLEALLGPLTRPPSPGGQLAVQVPANHDHPSHRLAHEIAREPPFSAALSGYARGKPVLEPEEYARLLFRLGYREQHVRLQVYGHALASPADVVDWVRGTLGRACARPAQSFIRKGRAAARSGGNGDRSSFASIASDFPRVPSRPSRIRLFSVFR